MIEKAIYIHIMLCDKNYRKFEQLEDNYLINLHLLRGLRSRNKIFFISSDMLNLVASMDQGFCGIPVTKYVKFDNQDY